MIIFFPSSVRAAANLLKQLCYCWMRECRVEISAVKLPILRENLYICPNICIFWGIKALCSTFCPSARFRNINMSCLLFCMCIYIHRVITDIVCELCYACKIMALFSSIFCFCHAMHFCKIFIIVIDAKFLTLASFYTLACSYSYSKMPKNGMFWNNFSPTRILYGFASCFFAYFSILFFRQKSLRTWFSARAAF